MNQIVLTNLFFSENVLFDHPHTIIINFMSSITPRKLQELNMTNLIDKFDMFNNSETDNQKIF